MSATRTIYQAIEEAILEYTDGTGRIYSEQEEGLWNIADRTAAALAPTPDLAQTVIEQAEKIKRLENALIDHLKAEGEQK